MTKIVVDWNSGRPNRNAEQDEARAAAAAERILDAAGADYKEAEAEYQRQLSDFDSERITGLALVWAAAATAADMALTEGWHNTEGASCSIRAA